MTQLLFFLLSVREGKKELICWFIAQLCGLLNSIFNLVDFIQNWYVFKDSVNEEVLKQWILDVEERR